MIEPKDLQIDHLGETTLTSPLIETLQECHTDLFFRKAGQRVLFDPKITPETLGQELLTLERAGPREKLFFDPSKTKAAIVTCGGLCPGLNDVIRSLVMSLYYRYGVQDILGIRYGYHGLAENTDYLPVQLTPERVRNIHNEGGTILGTSRGTPPKEEILKFIEKNKIDILFTIGGDGTLKGASEIASKARAKNLSLSVVGIPKTIDNDILYIDQSFGFKTAFTEAVRSITSAHNEAASVKNGIGIVKLMGRSSGFISCHAALAMNDVNFVLIPEIPFRLEGAKSFLEALEARVSQSKNTVIVVSEGAGQDFFQSTGEVDKSGNKKLQDIGIFLRDKIKSYFKEKSIDVNLKYIDPSYNIRSVPASAPDSEYALTLADHAVHAAMAGKTNLVVGKRFEHYVHIPMPLIAQGRRHVDPHGELWFSVLQATGQPVDFQINEEKQNA